MTFSNPYTAGNPVHGPEKFIGRADILRDALRVLQHPEANAIVLYGQRRIGKTSVMLHLQKQLSAGDAYKPVYFDLQNRASLPLEHVLYQMAQKISAVTAAELPDREQFERDARFFAETFLPAACQPLNHRHLVMLLDEFDVLDQPQREQAGKTFFPYLQKWMRMAQGVQFIFVLGRRPEELSTDTLATFKGIRARKVSLMAQEDCLEIIRQSEQHGSLTWRDEAAERVWHWTRGHPYLTQLLCGEIWEAVRAAHSGDSPPAVAANDVNAAIEKTLEQGANAFQWMWNGLPPAERVVMAAMAETPHEEISLDELADRLHQSKVRLILRELELAPDTLARWDLLHPTDGHFRFAVPLLRRWVAAEKPLRRVKAELDSLEPLAESLYRSGEGFYKMGNLEEAERLLRNAMNVNPNHFRARLLLGQVLLGRGDAASAVEMLEPAYHFDPRSAQPGLIGALLALAETQDGSARLNTYNRILELDPEQITAMKKKQSFLLEIAKTASQKGNFDAALHLYRQTGDDEGVTSVLAGKQKLARRLALAKKREKAEDWTGAMGIYQTLLQEFPDRKDWQARLRHAANQKTLAESYLQAGLALRQGKKDAARRLLTKIVGFQPDYKDALRYLFLVVKGIDVEEILKENRLARARQHVEELGAGVTLEMVWIPGGNFVMGSPEDEVGRFDRESPQHAVAVPSFFLGKYPVTQEQWEAVMGENPSRFQDAKRPVDSVDWHEAARFCAALRDKTGKAYRLPSEAEWEYACRAGTTTPFHFGNAITFELANYDATRAYSTEPVGEYRGETSRVGSFPPNGFGVHDMHGNVWEWCADAWHRNYENAPRDGSSWDADGDESLRVMRGGAWDILPNGCRSAFRDFDNSASRDASYGFRVAMSAKN